MTTIMRRALNLGIAITAIGLLAPAAVQACGDKLVVLGGGVRFERVFHSRHPGKVVVFANPDTKLGAANRELDLSHALTHAGHSVQVVESRSELERVLLETRPDLVVMDWADAAKIRMELAASVDAPAILSVLYRPSAAELAAAQEQRHCVAEATKRKGRNVMRTVDEMMESREKGIPIVCDDPPEPRKI